MSWLFGNEQKRGLLGRLGFEFITLYDWSGGSGGSYMAGRQLVLRLPMYYVYGVAYVKIIFGWVDFTWVNANGFRTFTYADAFTQSVVTVLACQTDGLSITQMITGDLDASLTSMPIRHNVDGGARKFGILIIGIDSE